MSPPLSIKETSVKASQNIIGSMQASPNPFNPTTTFTFSLSESGQVTLTVFDLTGRLVATIISGWQEAGSHQASFNGSHLPSGIYLAKLEAGSFSATQKIVLLK
jgi:hypothetical protein